MKYLFKRDYAEILYVVIKNNLTPIQIAEYFISIRNQYGDSNLGFERELKDIIDYAIEQRAKIQQSACESVRLSGGFEFYEGANGNVPFYFIFPQPEDEALLYDEYISMDFGHTEKLRSGLNIFLKKIPEKSNDSDWIVKFKDFTNNHDDVKPTEVFQHFFETLVKTQILTVEDLNKFLLIAFDKKQTPRERFKLNDRGKKQKVIRAFYSYYTLKANKVQGIQKSYAALLGEYFEGYSTNEVYTNFSK